MDTGERRNLQLKKKSNPELFQLYEDQLALKHRSTDALKEAKRVLSHFNNYLDNHRPSPELAASLGVPVKLFDYILAAVIVITMVASMQAVGALLAVCLLVAPAATLYLYLDSPGMILWGGGVLGVLIAIAAVIISNVANIPTGPAMVILLGIVFIAGFAFSPRYGLLAVLRSRYVPD